MSLTRTADTDDDGSGTTGTIRTNAWKTAIYDAVDGRWTEQTTTSTGTVNDLSITSGSLEADVLRCNNATDLTLTGIVAPASPTKPGKRLIIYSVGAGNVLLKHQNTGSTVGNRFINFATSGDTPLAAGSGFAVYVYDATVANGRWRLVAHEQGAWLTPGFTAGNYTGNASMTWTLAAGDVTTQKYRLSGRTLQVSFVLATTTVGGTPSTTLQIGNGTWGSFTIASTMQTLSMRFTDNSGTFTATPGLISVTASGTAISLFKDGTGSANWTASTDLTTLAGEIVFEVT